VAYAATRHDAANGCMFISKLYVLSASRKSGAGRQTLDLIERAMVIDISNCYVMNDYKMEKPIALER